MQTVKLFNSIWYLQQNPDIAAAVQAGLIDAETHFTLFGRPEGRSPSPLFNPHDYLSNNPDVAQAVQNGLLTAYDHFINFGVNEGRSPNSLFSQALYLQQNPDVAQAVLAGIINPVQHLLLFGASEERVVNPAIHLGLYMNANTDVQDAVSIGVMSALDHLIMYGVREGRDLGNGISLDLFQNDPVFQQALANGNPLQALVRMNDVAPFIPTFQRPEGWTPAANTPIPTNFVPTEGFRLVVPPEITVPPGTDLRDTVFVIDQPGGGGVSHPLQFDLTTGVDILRGGNGNDTFDAAGDPQDDAGATLNTNDQLDGRAGQDTLTIANGGYVDGAAPTLHSIETINNANFGSANLDLDGCGCDPEWVYTDKTLNLANAQGVTQLWSDFTNVNGTPAPDEDDAPVFLAFSSARYTHASPDTVFGVRTSETSGLIALDIGLSPSGGDDTLKIKLAGSADGDSLLDLSWNARTNDGVHAVEIEATQGTHGVNFAGTATMERVTVSGQGNLLITTDFGLFSTDDALANLTEFDAHAATGYIYASLDAATALASATLGTGDDMISVAGSVLSAGRLLDGGDGDDMLAVVLPGDAAAWDALDFGVITNFEHLLLAHDGEGFAIALDATTLDLSQTTLTSATLSVIDGVDLDETFTIKGSETLTTLNIDASIFSFGGALRLEDFTSLELDVTENFWAPLQLAPELADVTFTITNGTEVQLDTGSEAHYTTLTIDLDQDSRYLSDGLSTNGSLETLTVRGEVDSFVEYGISLTESGLATIDLSGMSGSSRLVHELLSPASPQDIQVLVGAGDLYHNARLRADDAHGIDTFVFADDVTINVTLEHFLNMDNGASDILDLSQIQGVTSLAALNISDNGFDTSITSDHFDGEIILMGITDYYFTDDIVFALN